MLKALGYQSAYNRSPALEEEIQMHADALYQQLVTHEAAVDKATAEGQPAPVFDPTAAIRREQAKLDARRREVAIAQSRTSSASTTPFSSPAAVEDIEPGEQTRHEWDKILAELPERDRPAEEAALRADLQSKAKLARAAEAIWDATRRKRTEEQERKADAKRAEAEARGEILPPKAEVSNEPKQVWQQLLDRWKGE